MTHPSSSLPEDFLGLVQHRGRVFTTSFARLHGIPDSRLKLAMREDLCHRQAPGLYSLDAEMDADSTIWAGLLVVGPQATLGGNAAAFVRGERPAPDVVDIWTGHRCLTDRGPWRFHRGLSPDVPPHGDDGTEAEFAHLATTRQEAAGAALERAQRLLSLTQRERFLGIAEAGVPFGQSFLEARFASDVTGPHGLPAPRWTPADDGTGPVLEAHLLGGSVRVVLDPRRDVTAPWGPGWDTTGYVDGYRSEIRVTFRLDDIVMRPCSTAERYHEVLDASAVPAVLNPCRSCRSWETGQPLNLLGSGGRTW